MYKRETTRRKGRGRDLNAIEKTNSSVPKGRRNILERGRVGRVLGNSISGEGGTPWNDFWTGLGGTRNFSQEEE